MGKSINKDTDQNREDRICPNCLSLGMTIFHHLKQVPVHSVMNIKSRKEALNFLKGDITLGFCKACGFISNLDYDPDLIMYSEDCEESQGYSPTFNQFLERTASDLVDEYNLYGKNIIEIGCGKGEFLRLLCRLGQNHGIGFDPAYDPERDRNKDDDSIRFIKEYYSEEYTDYRGDIVCCRMTLEHIGQTYEFIRMVRRSIGDRLDTIVFIQVPDMIRVLKECAFEDIYYEHCSYFSPGSLARLFRKCGFDILDLRTVYNGQYIILEASPLKIVNNTASLPLENDLEEIVAYTEDFKNNYSNIMESWLKIVQDASEKAKKIVLWGSGSKAVAFLTGLNISDKIEYVVDINPHRQGTYMAGTGQRVVAPGFLKEYRPDIVIIMNPVYLDEIKHDINQMVLNPEILSLGEKGKN